ncbi:hypothetical protein [Rhizobium sp. GCM10022189]|uniref:hypothetical protein n=1 Tax=Rhizobium sp. GCM10022189 TaxID=3252654 RepID=UPI00360BA122
MSLVRAAVRISAIMALRDRTLVGSNVLDSQIVAIKSNDAGSLRLSEDAPFIAVYTDEASTKDTTIGNATRALGVNGPTAILFESGIAATMTEADPDTDETKIIGIGLPATDGPMEFMLDMVMRQIVDTLNDPHNEWSKIFLGFMSRVIDVARARAGSDEDGLRVAGQQMRVMADLLTDPVKGEPLKPTSTMARFLAKTDSVTDPMIRAQMEMISAQISGSELPWHIVQRRYGMTSEEADALQVGSADPAGGDIGITEVSVSPAELAQP